MNNEEIKMNKALLFDQEAKNLIKEGASDVAKAVRVTLGAKGRNVAIYAHDRSFVITKDGVTVVKNINFKNQYKDLGAQAVKEASQKTCDQAGDGTTTATILASAIINEGMRVLMNKVNPILLKRGIDKAVSEIVKELKRVAKPVKSDFSDLDYIAKVSANNDDEIGGMISKAIKAVGKEGIVNAKGVVGGEAKVEIVDGFNIESGATNRYFLNDKEKMQTTLDNPIILIYDHVLMDQAQVFPVLEIATRTRRPLLVIAEDIDGEALATMAYNNYRGSVNCVAIKAPYVGDLKKEFLEDVATLVGGVLVSDDKAMNIEDVSAEVLGEAEKIIVTRSKTTIISGYGNQLDIDAKIKELRSRLNPELSKQAAKNLEMRIGCLIGKAAVITVGAASEVEANEKLDRVEDALWATRSAIEEGVIPGGGSTLIHSQKVLNKVKCNSIDEELGVNIIREAIEAPLRQIAENAGEDGGAIVNIVKNSRDKKGWNALTGKLEDLSKSGIIDPVKVTRVALENAASVAGMLLTTECVIVNDLG